LIGGLVLAAPFLFSTDDLKRIFAVRWSTKTWWVWAAAGAIVVSLYWMRSGNHPLLPVSDLERGLRDAMETFFTARPRFKEFLFGHPLFLLGLWLGRRPVERAWWGDGRVCLWLGLIGQISILNTFTHFHAPFFYCAVRTLHGVWLGLALALICKRVVHLRQ
jgi:hypothetical protein